MEILGRFSEIASGSVSNVNIHRTLEAEWHFMIQTIPRIPSPFLPNVVSSSGKFRKTGKLSCQFRQAKEL